MHLTIEEARALYTGTDSVHDFDHILRVLALAERIARAEGADLAIVQAAALLHDWGRPDAPALGRDHADVASERTAELLASRDLPADHIESIVHAIAAHRFRSDPAPQTLEAQVIFDADKLDAIGAIGVARAFAYCGGHGQRLWAPRDVVDLVHWQTHGDDPSVHTAVHEFVVKLSRIKGRLYTAEGRRIAEDRHTYMAAFFDRLDAEVLGVR